MGVHSEIYNIGLILMSLMTGINQRIQTPGNENWNERAGNNCYSLWLHTVVLSCLAADYKNRGTVRELLKNIDTGLESWERVYGSANSKDLPEFMSYHLSAHEQFHIGDTVPESWPQRKRRKKEEEIAYEHIDPAILGDNPSAPLKKRRTASQSTLVDPQTEILTSYHATTRNKSIQNPSSDGTRTRDSAADKTSHTPPHDQATDPDEPALPHPPLLDAAASEPAISLTPALGSENATTTPRTSMLPKHESTNDDPLILDNEHGDDDSQSAFEPDEEEERGRVL